MGLIVVLFDIDNTIAQSRVIYYDATLADESARVARLFPPHQGYLIKHYHESERSFAVILAKLDGEAG